MSNINLNHTASFETALTYCLGNEGLFVDNPLDRGGPTYKGITIGLLQRYRGRPVTTLELKSLSDQDIRDIYFALFWEPLKISGLPQVIATAILDTAINQGQIPSIKLAQAALGPQILPDGILGPESLKSLDQVDPKMFIYAYVGEIQDKFARICKNAPNQTVFLEGWLRRSRRLFSLV